VAERCFHCGEAIAPGSALTALQDGTPRAVCCIGCRAAVEWIEGLGLADYYRLRSEPAARAEAAADFSAWDRPALDRLYVRREGDQAEACVLVGGLRCAACSWLIERALGALPGVAEVSVNPAARRLRLRWEAAVTPLSRLLSALARLGYTAHPLEAGAIDSMAQREQRTALKRLVIAGLGMMQAMMYAVALYAGAFEGMDPLTRDFFRWLGFLVTTPVVLYSAQPFFAGARRELAARRLGMDVPVAFAIALVYVASLAEALRGGGQVYFDSAAMFTFFLLGGRYLEMRARHRAADVVDALARLQPALAQRRTATGAEETVGVHELVPGDVVHVADGATVPADGELLDERCSVDESMLSGESAARARRRGDTLLAGSVLVQGPALLRVTRVGSDTVLSSMLRLIARAGAERPRVAREGERLAAGFVAAVLALTLITAGAWLWFDPARAFPAALAVLVVACPCAFALAVPTALTRALAVLARQGVLVVRADALERLCRVRRVLFDKTGTLTENRLELLSVVCAAGVTREQALALGAALERGSRHPLACALRTAAEGMTLPPAQDLEAIAGQGVRGTLGAESLRLGRASFALGPGAADDGSVVLAGAHGEIARFQLRERVRGEAATTLQALAAQGIALEILSGDAAERVEAVARRLGVATWHARQTPQDKLARLDVLRRGSEGVAMVGDGVNDAPVLAGADVGIALAGAAELSQAHADLVLGGDRLDGLLQARAVALATRRVMRQNLAWAMAYNLGAVPLAALGLVPPWLAAIGMSLSSLGVLLNSLRIAAPDSRPQATPVVAGAVQEVTA